MTSVTKFDPLRICPGGDRFFKKIRVPGPIIGGKSSAPKVLRLKEGKRIGVRSQKKSLQREGGGTRKFGRKKPAQPNEANWELRFPERKIRDRRRSASSFRQGHPPARGKNYKENEALVHWGESWPHSEVIHP